MEYFEKLDNPAIDLSWNIPDLKQGTLNVIGGSDQSFKTSIKVSEFIGQSYPLKTINTILPDSLQSKLPALPNFLFLPSTESGSFADSEELSRIFDSADFNFLIGDFSKNSITKKSVGRTISETTKPTLITRDTVELLTSAEPEKSLLNDQLILFASLPQLQTLLRSIYYPKMLLLSQPLMQVVDILHKFTLSYSVKIVTFHTGQILFAENGVVKSIALEKTEFNPLTLWSGELAAKIAVFNLYNPNNFLNATTSAIFEK